MKYSKILVIGWILASLFTPHVNANFQWFYSTDIQEGNYVSVPNKAKLDQALKLISDYRFKLNSDNFNTFLDRLLVKIQSLKQKYVSTSSLRLQLQYLEDGITKIKNHSLDNNNDDDDVLCNLGFCDDWDGTGTNGICGTAQWQSFSSVPSTNLCSSGNATRVSGNGPWYWTCVGLNGGNNVNCSANASTYSNNGSCGSANGISTSSQPTSWLCNVGNATSVTGSGPRYWTCDGINGGTSTSCSAPYNSSSGNASCGSAHTNTFINAPSTGLCNSGYATSVNGNGPWYWNCQSTSGNYSVNCRASYSGNSGNSYARCGYANGQTYSSRPTSWLCDSGYASSVSGSGPRYWICNGNDGRNISCSASSNSGDSYAKCWYADEQTYSSRPTSWLCEKWYASSVSWDWPWYWTCIGTYGSSVSCNAYYNTSSTSTRCGYANGQTYSSKPTSWLCDSGYASNVSGNGPRYWTCNGNDGRNISCSASSNNSWNEDGKCGSSNGQRFYSKPNYNLCERGTASWVSGTGPWYWSCTGNNGASQSCNAYSNDNDNEDAMCGSANGQTFYSRPSSNLCEIWNASVVSWTGPWSWTCTTYNGTNHETTASCNANYGNSGNTYGRCGYANGKTYYSKPSWGLCDSGTATDINGSWPWYWSCRGSDGNSVSCTAYSQYTNSNDGKCGSADGQSATCKPTTNLCSSGTASSVTGSGPWYWTCIGQNGWKTAYCSAQDTTPSYEPKCGTANEKAFPFKPNSWLCDSGYASEVLGEGPRTRTCRSMNGQLVSCSAQKLRCPIRIQIQWNPNETFRCQD